ncbi:PfkB family carbohydrate kinase [Aestuariibacter sp. A3R04]|uniref:PfkB family carbohydrate kinase n=1 Tax=Aestuariibacter sp. A3R04 TaxID=2841571 RepID=UPI001C09D418|nr:PfkB family carbohydrate kinase [Aestuariibacter sp. A3R04]MBU3022200.1 adenylyltransferase/cytidyltransferase family protein [Aestuariibacter sp. A3R04]
MNKQQYCINEAKRIKQTGKRICFVSGNFNIIHPGHLRFLLFAKEQADILVVGLYEKSSSISAYFSDEERHSALSALSFVDEVILLDNTLSAFLTALEPDIVVKGKEWENTDNIEQQLVDSYGGKLVFSSGEKQFSSKELLQQQLNENTKLTQQLQKYHERYNISNALLTGYLNRVCDINIAVFGDIIVDEYQECLPIGMSQEDPTIAVSPLESYRYLGGAGIVAAHAKSLGAETDFYSVAGRDAAGDFAQSKLREYGVNAYVIQDSCRPTTHKLRYRAKNKTLLRVNSFRKHAIDKPLIDAMLDNFISNIHKYDVVLFADFSFGVLCPALIKHLQALCLQHDIPMVADSQTSSQIGDLTKFTHLMLTTPTEIEARLAAQDDDNGLIQVSKDLAEQLIATNLIVTLGSEGILIRHRVSLTDELLTDNLPALTDNAIDTAGAGDALLVTATLMLCTGASIWQAAFVGSVSSAIQVNTRGNLPLPKHKVLSKISELVG